MMTTICLRWLTRRNRNAADSVAMLYAETNTDEINYLYYFGFLFVNKIDRQINYSK